MTAADRPSPGESPDSDNIAALVLDHRRRSSSSWRSSAWSPTAARRTTRRPSRRPQQLTVALQQAGLTVPADQDILIRSLGSDGGAVCDNPANALGRATLLDQMTNGADFVGRRPVIVDPRILVGEALILQIYCPEKLAGVQGQDRRPQDRRRDQGLMAARRGPQGGRRRPVRRLRVGAGRQRQHVGGDDPAAVDQRGRRRADRPAAVGGDRLLARRRRRDRHLGRARRRARAPQGVPRRARAVHRLVRADRALDGRRRRRRRPDDPGRLRRDDPRLRHEPAVRRRRRARRR